MNKFTSEELVTELMYGLEAVALLGKCHYNFKVFDMAHKSLLQFLNDNTLALLDIIPEDMDYSSEDKYNEIYSAIDGLEYEEAMELITKYVRY